jgi:hypothetical protein
MPYCGQCGYKLAVFNKICPNCLSVVDRILDDDYIKQKEQEKEKKHHEELKKVVNSIKHNLIPYVDEKFVKCHNCSEINNRGDKVCRRCSYPLKATTYHDEIMLY